MIFEKPGSNRAFVIYFKKMITIKKLTKNMHGEPLFEGVSFVVQRGDKIGLVGSNGCGKSTLLKIILGQVEADGGDVQIEHEQVGYLSQELPFVDGETVGNFLSTIHGSKITEMLQRVGLGGISPELHVVKLSGGQKTKLLLAKILLDKPSMLLLDEPTNHMDYKGLAWLEEFVREFRGGILVVSHDRRFLDNSVNKILEIDSANHKFVEYAGGYTEYRAEKEVRQEKQEDAYERQQKLKKKTEQWLALKRQQATAHPNPAVGRMIAAREKWLRREVLDNEIARPKENKKITGMELAGESASAKLMVRTENLVKSFQERPVVRGVSFEMRGTEHVLLAGENGSGKTTILKILMGAIRADQGEFKIGENVRVGYFAQEHEILKKDRTVLDEFMSTERVSCTELDARSILGSFLFQGRDVYKKVSVLSLGEKVRLVFAKLTNQKNELLILDEPTNHLDVQTREIIEDALLEYRGAILVVSHDRYFLDKIGIDRTLTLQNGVICETVHCRE